MNLLLVLAALVPAYCGYAAGNPLAHATVGDSITVENGGQSYAAASGYSTWDVLHPDRIPEPPCSGLSPLACEYNQTNPRISLIQIGSNDPAEWTATWFSMNNIREIVGLTAERGILPVLYTVPENVNKPVEPLNEFIRALALEQGLPLIDLNVWLSSLPNSGLREDGVHLSIEGNELRTLLTSQLVDFVYTACGW